MIFLYVIRSLIARGRTTLTALLVIAATTAAITLVLGLQHGLESALLGNQPEDLAVLVSKGATSDNQGTLPADVLARIRVAPGVATNGTQPLVSPELAVSYVIKRPTGVIDRFRVRGVDPIAFAVHPAVKLIHGRMPSAGARDALVGARLLGKYDHLSEGGWVRIGRHKWNIVGTLSAPGEIAESEVWCDRTALAQERGSGDARALYVKLDAPARIAEVRDVVDKMREHQLDFITANQLHQRTLAEATLYVRAISFVVALLCISAVFAGTNATYSMFLGQVRELGTLMAMGFTRRRIAMMVLLQSVILALVGAVVGIGVALLLDGRSFTFHEMMLVYEIQVDGPVLLAGTLAAASIGVASSLIAVLQTYRLNILAVLRD